MIESKKKTLMPFCEAKSGINVWGNFFGRTQWMRRLSVIVICCCYFMTFLMANETPIISINYNNTNQLSKDNIDQILKSNEGLFIPDGEELEVVLSEDFIRSGTVLYYKIEGLEKEWNVSNYPIVRYTFLPNGNHKLLITNDLRRENIVLRLKCGSLTANKFSLFNLWWFQPLAQVCLILIPITFFYFIALSRSRKNLKVEVVRNQIASDLHDDVGANLGAIKNLTELILRKAAKEGATKSKVVDKIQSYTNETLSKLQDTVWAINPLNDTVEQLLEKMREFAKLMVPAKGIKLNFENENEGVAIQKLDMSQRHAMFMMYKEAVNNAVKYSQAENIAIKIKPTKRTILITIEDDGIGFDTTQKFKGNGLKNFKSRAKENHIEFDLNSEEGQGTKITMEVFGML